MAFKKYNGPDKYHFRIYKANGHHPFIVVLISEQTDANGHRLLSGYMITHDMERALSYKNNYIQLNKNPNPNDEKPCFVCKTKFKNIKDVLFSKPYNNWHLSEEDILIIDSLENQ